jgi:hypothetical protein
MNKNGIHEITNSSRFGLHEYTSRVRYGICTYTCSSQESNKGSLGELGRTSSSFTACVLLYQAINFRTQRFLHCPSTHKTYSERPVDELVDAVDR